MMDGRAPTNGIIVIPPAKRFPYGDDLAAARSAGRARASVRSRLGHLIERSSGYRAARVSRCEGIRTANGTAAAVARAGDRPASQGRTRAATQMKPLGVAVQHLRTRATARTMSQRVRSRSQLDSNPEVSGKAGAVQSFVQKTWGLWSLWAEAGAVDNGFIVIHGKPAGAQHCPQIHRLNRAFRAAMTPNLFFKTMSFWFSLHGLRA